MVRGREGLFMWEQWRKAIYDGEEGMKTGIGTEYPVCCKRGMEIMLFDVFDTVYCIAMKRAKY